MHRLLMLAPQHFAEALHVAPVPFDDPAATALITQVQECYVERYGGPDATAVDPTEFAPPHGLFLVGRLAGKPIACGGWRTLAPGLAEIKRMYVTPAHRGRGLSRIVLAALEDAARAAGVPRLCLETGDRQPEALGLYRATGWEPIEKYGLYRNEPGSLCFGKSLRAP